MLTSVGRHHLSRQSSSTDEGHDGAMGFERDRREAQRIGRCWGVKLRRRGGGGGAGGRGPGEVEPD